MFVVANVFAGGRLARGFAALIVLKAPDMPSILFESGYLTNADDAAWLRTAEGQRQIAQGMREAIETHFAARSLRR